MKHSEPSGRRADIMIVDDAPENLDVLVEILKEEPYDIRPVTNAETALRAAGSRPPDLVLVDINMPGMDGITLCRRFRETGKLSAVPVIFISGSTGPDAVRNIFAAGGVDYMVKPFQREEVLARVKVQLELRFLREEVVRYKRKCGEL